MTKEIKSGDVIQIRSFAQVPPGVLLAFADLPAAIIAESEAEAAFFLRGLLRPKEEHGEALRTG